MFSGVTKVIKEKVDSTKLEDHPYTWMECDNFLPDDIYSAIISNKIPSTVLYNLQERGRVSSGYSKGRLVIDLKPEMPELPDNIRDFWEDFGIWLHYSLRNIFIERFCIPRQEIKVDCLYSRDGQGFGLRPHTDTNKKIFTALLYIPGTVEDPALGTSIYVPKKQGFTCKLGTHHQYSDFNIYKTIAYKKNKLFCFMKSDNSFHGLEPIPYPVERDLIIFDIQVAKC